MATMSHTPAQRKAWHEGKKRPRESSFSCLRRNRKAGNHIGAFTPAWLKRGLFYAPLPVNQRDGSYRKSAA